MVAKLVTKTWSIYLMDNSKYGCYNRQLKESYQVPVRDIASNGNFMSSAVYKVSTLTNTMSKDCHYDLRSTDVRCSGCKWL